MEHQPGRDEHHDQDPQPTADGGTAVCDGGPRRRLTVSGRDIPGSASTPWTVPTEAQDAEFQQHELSNPFSMVDHAPEHRNVAVLNALNARCRTPLRHATGPVHDRGPGRVPLSSGGRSDRVTLASETSGWRRLRWVSPFLLGVGVGGSFRYER